MVTDILSPRQLGSVLELYGFDHSAYLALYLGSFELVQGHITGVPQEAIDEGLETEDHALFVRACLSTANGAEVMVLGHSRMDTDILVVIPSREASIEGAMVFGTETLLEYFQDIIGVSISKSSQRPVQ